MSANILGEFLGCVFLILFGCGASATLSLSKSKGVHHVSWLSVASGWGLAVMVAIFVAKSAGSVQADINPAVTLAKYILGGIYSFDEVLFIAVAQILGCAFGAFLLWLAYFPHWKVTKDPLVKLGVFVTIPAIRAPVANLTNEIIGTAVLVFGIGAIFGKATNHGQMAPEFSPYLLGFFIWAIILSLGGSTGYAINPARDLGPRIAHSILPIAGKGGSDWEYGWIPVVGPFIGGTIGAILWKLILY